MPNQITINPATGKILAEWPALESKEIEARLNRAEHAAGRFKVMAIGERQTLIARLGEELERRADELALLITREMGKPIREAKAEVAKCVATCRFCAEHGADWLRPAVLVDGSPRVTVHFRPLGPILGIMPWNYPAWQVIRFAVPTLLAGNVILLKHAPNTWGSARLLAECFAAAGLGEGIYQDLPVPVAAIESVLRDRRIKGVSLTGSTRAGRAVAALAGQTLKPAVLELGGADAYIVLADADVELAARVCVEARMVNGGQSCIAAKRWIVVESVYDEFLERARTLLAEYSPVNPELKDCRLGPLARADLRDTVKRQVGDWIKAGARTALGGQDVVDKDGFYYPATLLVDLDETAPIADEEIFGPVACLWRVRDENAALALANRSQYGLGGAIFSRDAARAERLATSSLASGMCAINGAVRSDPRWPFGGIGDSGFGRELAEFGARSFVNVKTILVDN